MRPSLSVGAQLMFYTLAFRLIFAGKLRRAISQWAHQQPWWEVIRRREGNLAKGGQRDLVLMMVLAAHHLASGAAMLTGSAMGWAELWRQGLLNEIGFELCDSADILISAWPYDHSGMAWDIRTALVLHHIPGIATVFPVVTLGLDKSSAAQRMCSWLLVAAGVAAIAGSFVYTRDFSKPREMRQAAAAEVFAGLVFIYARFVEFPCALLDFQGEVKNRPDLPAWFHAGVVAAGASMMGFNSIILAHNMPKVKRYVEWAIHGAPFGPESGAVDVKAED